MFVCVHIDPTNLFIYFLAFFVTLSMFHFFSLFDITSCVSLSLKLESDKEESGSIWIIHAWSTHMLLFRFGNNGDEIIFVYMFLDDSDNSSNYDIYKWVNTDGIHYTGPKRYKKNNIGK